MALKMMIFAARGVRKGNPRAKVASFSPALSTEGLGGGLPYFFPVMYGVAWVWLQIPSFTANLRAIAKDFGVTLNEAFLD